jgi:hypothetical protein
MKNEKIICHECHKPILNKDDLAVVGNSFITYHDKCFEKIKHKNIYAFYSGYKSNGIFPWIMLIILNSAIWSTFYFFDTPINEVILFSAFISSIIIFFRVMSYVLYERHFD